MTDQEREHRTSVVAYAGIIRAVCNGCGWESGECQTAAEARRQGKGHEWGREPWKGVRRDG